MSAARYVVPLLILVLIGCNGEDDEQTMATRPATSAGGETAPADAAPAQRRPVRLLRLGRFDEPTYLTAPRGDRRRFVVEREGRIRVVQGGRVLGRPFLDISDRVSTGGESGLLSMAFARDYRGSRRFWVYYTDNQGFIQIDEFRAGRGDPQPRGSRLAALRAAGSPPPLQPQGRSAPDRA